LRQNSYIRSMSKVTRFMANIVGRLFFTLAILIYTAEGNFQAGKNEIQPPNDDQK